MIELGTNWKFDDIQQNVVTIKAQYEFVLSSFLDYKIKERVDKLYKIKKQIFEYENIQYWQRERLWEVMNGDFSIEEFRRL